MHLEIAALAGRLREIAQPPERAAPHAVRERLTVRAQHAPQPAQRDAEIVERLHILGMPEAHARIEQAVEPLEGDEARALRRGQVEEIGGQWHDYFTARRRICRGVSAQRSTPVPPAGMPSNSIASAAPFLKSITERGCPVSSQLATSLRCGS